jgi:hypothetical protein
MKSATAGADEMDMDGGLVIFEVDAEEEEGVGSGISAISLLLHESRGRT